MSHWTKKRTVLVVAWELCYYPFSVILQLQCRADSPPVDLVVYRASFCLAATERMLLPQDRLVALRLLLSGLKIMIAVLSGQEWVEAPGIISRHVALLPRKEKRGARNT